MASWWDETIPHFSKYEPVPVELPGFGNNPSDRYQNLGQLADALIAGTEPGQEIFAVGINALVTLHALARKPGHFSQTYLLAPVGAFLWKRRFVKFMSKKPIRNTIHYLLKNHTWIFKKKFSQHPLPQETMDKIREGYRKCRAFTKYFEMVRPHNALDHFEWISDPVHLIWGQHDAVLGIRQASAWDTILPRAELSITLREDWDHYPYFSDPRGFVKDIESFEPGFRSHSKSGRLKLASLAGLPVPQHHSIQKKGELKDLPSKLDKGRLYAIRSSGSKEDHIDHSEAGLNRTDLRIPMARVSGIVDEMLDDGMHTIVVQEFVEPKVSGVAFCRNITREVEYVSGHLEHLAEGTVNPHRAIFSKMGKDWTISPSPLEDHPSFPFDGLNKFLEEVIEAFHYVHADIEWAWDGRQFWLFQLRPVTAYDWRRLLTSANLDEILPKKVSRIMEYAQRRSALTISRIWSLWDERILEDNEPFSVVWKDASYINSDIFLSRFVDWGLPGSLYAKEIGGTTPDIPFRPFRLIANGFRMMRMSFTCRKNLLSAKTQMEAFKAELDLLESQKAAPRIIANWFVRYYTFIVQMNMLINSAITSSFGDFWAKAHTVYGSVDPGKTPHRLKFESDPASERPDVKVPPLSDFPIRSSIHQFFTRIGMPGMNGKFYEVREWFRDNNMKLFFQLHHALKGTEWLDPIEGIRERSGTFWQDGGATLDQDFGFIIYPGSVEGIVGKDILIVDALEPGHYEAYKKAKAVISRTGGRLSHGSTLLRELKKPSAIIPSIPADLEGKEIELTDGKIRILEN